MWILFVYLARAIIMGTLMVFAIFFFLNVVFGFIGELNSLRGGYDAITAFWYVVFQSPYFLVNIFPMSLLVGTIFSLGKLSDQSELTVMRASGVSTHRLLAMVLSVGLLLVLGAMAVTEWVVPKSERYAQIIVNKGLNKTHFQETRYGVWLLQDGKFIHIQKMSDSGSMSNLSVFNYDGLKLKQIKHIKKGFLNSDGRWLFENVSTTDFFTSKVSKTKKNKEVMVSGASPDIVAQIQVKADKLSVLDLLEQKTFLENNALNTDRLQQALWKRVAYPVSTLLMLFLVFPVIFKSNRSTSLSQKILFGVMFGVLFFVFNRITEQFGVIYDVPAWGPIFVPMVLFLMLGVWQYKKI